MELKKRKYKRNEVKTILDAVSSVSQSKTALLKAQIEELKLQNSKLKALVNKYEDQEILTHSVILDAEKTANSVKKEANDYLNLTFLNLRKISREYQDFFDYLLEKYPNYKVVSSVLETKKRIDEILNGTPSNDGVKKIKKILDDNKDKNAQFNPMSKINDYIASTSDSGFSLDEVLNPGELKLEDLCKELGLIEEKE